MARVLNRHIHGTPSGAVYIGRPSKWGNPFKAGVDGSRAEVIKLYKEWLESNTDLMNDARIELAGKDLVCSCSPKPCHGDILLIVANSDNGVFDTL